MTITLNKDEATIMRVVIAEYAEINRNSMNAKIALRVKAKIEEIDNSRIY